MTFDVLTIREMESEPAGRFGLTDSQYRALVLAASRGYYEVPKAVTLAELAEEIGVSHQALSEQLRRGTGALVEDVLSVGASLEAEGARLSPREGLPASAERERAERR